MGARLFRIDDERYSVCKRAGRGNATNGLRLLIDIIKENFDVDTLKPKQEITPVNEAVKAEKQPKKEAEPITRTLEQKYKELFFKHYNSEPIIAVKHRAAFKRIIQTVGKERSIELVELFFKSDNPYYEKECHPVWLMERDVNKIFANFSYSEEAAMEEFFNYIENKSKNGHGVKNVY